MSWTRRTTPLTASPSARDLATAAKRLEAAATRLVPSIPEDGVLHEQAALRVAQMSNEAADLASGKLVFESTETWRAVYEAVLSGCRQRRYLSVAIIETEDYWRDRPGRASLEFNCRLVQHGFNVARTLLIDEFFWPKRAELPDKQLLAWAKAQHDEGISVQLARLSEVEQELRLDFGVYGERAVGYQVVDESGKTERFMLLFDAESRNLAEDRWRRLELFVEPLDDLLASKK